MVKNKVEKAESKFVAVIVADNFIVEVAPLLSCGKGKKTWGETCLANNNLFDYTFEWISRTEVTDIVVVVSKCALEVTQHLLEPWQSRFQTFSIVQCQNCQNFGDSLREIDSRSVISSDDFLLVQCGALCSDSLQESISAYRARKRKDKDNVMTLIYTEVSDAECGDRRVIGLEANRLTIYHKAANAQQLDVNKSMFLANTVIRRDLRETGIAICSAKVLPHFSDNPDFCHFDNVIREILANEEILQQNIHVDILPPHTFAYFVRNLDSILVANVFCLQRWSYPLVPDMLTLFNQTRYSCSQTRNIYLPIEKCQAAVIDNCACIGPNAAIGSLAEISANSKIRNSSIGCSSKIGHNSHVFNSVIGSNCQIGADCQINGSILGNEVQIGDACEIGPRCLIGHNVNLPSGTVLLSGTVVCANEPPDEFDHIEASKIEGTTVFRWTLNKGELWPDGNVKRSIDQSFNYDGYLSSESDSDGEQPKTTILATTSTDRMKGMDAYHGSNYGDMASNGAFYEEILDSLQRGLDEKTPVKNLILEINASKLAYNVAMEELARLLMKAVLNIATKRSQDSQSLYTSLKVVCKQWKDLFKNYYRDQNAIDSRFKIAAQIQALLAVEDEVLTRPDLFLPSIAKFLYDLYEEEPDGFDMISEEAILEWHDKLQGEAFDILRPKLAEFIVWLQRSVDFE